MDIPLNLPPGRQQEFRDQFNAGLRRLSSGSSGSAGFLPDGSFEASATGSYRFDNGTEARLKWVLRKDVTGTLSGMSVEPLDTSVSNEWEASAQAFVTATLSAALAAARTRFFRRAHYFYLGPALDGEYWLPGLRLAPAIPNDAEPSMPGAERWVDIDMTVDAIDDGHASALADERSRRIAARLSLLLDVGFERRSYEVRWAVIPDEKGGFTNKRCQLALMRTDPSPAKMPDKGALCAVGRYTKTNDRELVRSSLQLGPDVRRILRGAETKKHPIGEAFDRCARLYQVGLVAGRQLPSVFLAYVVAAAAAIAESDPELGRFRDFIKRYAEVREENLNSFVDTLYGGIRSAHFHAGEFPLGEFAAFRTDPLMDDSDIERSSLRFMGLLTVRNAILRWCRERVADDPRADDESR